MCLDGIVTIGELTYPIAELQVDADGLLRDLTDPVGVQLGLRSAVWAGPIGRSPSGERQRSDVTAGGRCTAVYSTT